KKQLALVYYLKGQQENSPTKQIELYDKAIALDEGTGSQGASPVDGRYFVARTLAKLSLENPDLEAIRREAEKGVELAPRYPEAFGTLGRVCYRQARKESSPKPRLDKLRQAAENCKKSIQLYDAMLAATKAKPDERFPDLLVDYCQICL